MKGKLKGFMPGLILFVILNVIFVVGRNALENWGADQETLIAGNAILFVFTLISFLVALRGLHNPNPNVFMRTVMGSIMLKMFLIVIAAFVYISIYRKDINKPALFTCMGLYLVYTFLEVSGLMKMLKQKTHG